VILAIFIYYTNVKDCINNFLYVIRAMAVTSILHLYENNKLDVFLRTKFFNLI